MSEYGTFEQWWQRRVIHTRAAFPEFFQGAAEEAARDAWDAGKSAGNEEELSLTIFNFEKVATERDRLRYAADALAGAVDAGCDFGDLPESGEAWLNNVQRALRAYREALK